MKIINLILFLLFYGMIAVLNSSENYLSLDLSSRSTDILINKISNISKWDMHNGLNKESVAITNNILIQLLNEVNNASLNNSKKNILDRMESKFLSIPDKTMPLCIIYTNYNEIKGEALDKKLLIKKDGKVFQNPYSQESPFLEKTICAISPYKMYTYERDINFILNDDFSLINSISNESFQIDFDDGLGYRSVSKKDIINIKYSTIGFKKIRLKVQTDDIELYSNTLFEIKKINSNNGNRSSPDIRWITENDDYPYGIESNYLLVEGSRYDCYPLEWGFYPRSGLFTAYIFLGNGNTEIKKPVIYVKGMFVDGGKGDWGSSFDNINKNGLADALYLAGYDLIIMEYLPPLYEWTAHTVSSSALAIATLIDKVNNEKTSSNKNIIIGNDVGGILATYALAWMSFSENIDTDTNLLFTLDAPHAGLNIPLGFQKFIEFYRGRSGFTNSFLNFLGQPIMKQLLYSRYYPIWGTSYGEHDVLDIGYSQIETFNRGIFLNQYEHVLRDIYNNIPSNKLLPNDFKSIAISNGSSRGFNAFQLKEDNTLSDYNEKFFDYIGIVEDVETAGSLYAMAHKFANDPDDRKLLNLNYVGPHLYGNPNTPGTVVIDVEDKSYILNPLDKGNVFGGWPNEYGEYYPFDILPGAYNPLLKNMIDNNWIPEADFVSNFLKFNTVPTTSALDLWSYGVSQINGNEPMSPTNNLYYIEHQVNNPPVNLTTRSHFDYIYCDDLEYNSDQLENGIVSEYTSYVSNKIMERIQYANSGTYPENYDLYGFSNPELGMDIEIIATNRVQMGYYSYNLKNKKLTLRAGNEVVLEPGTSIIFDGEFETEIDETLKIKE